MCTLTYRLTEDGYSLFFNRDEQRGRAQALAPIINTALQAIYPIDPVGKGTWLGVHTSGLSLALLNFYQAEKNISEGPFTSRGEIIVQLLKNSSSVIDTLKNMDLQSYQPFLLCVFPSTLSRFFPDASFFQWDGEQLTKQHKTLPITSSGVDYPQVYQARKQHFDDTVSVQSPTEAELFGYHQSQQTEGKLSVKMAREDARTVSFSHLRIGHDITFDYVGHIDASTHSVSLKRQA